jgi:hypothetical protein
MQPCNVKCLKPFLPRASLVPSAYPLRLPTAKAAEVIAANRASSTSYDSVPLQESGLEMAAWELEVDDEEKE